MTNSSSERTSVARPIKRVEVWSAPPRQIIHYNATYQSAAVCGEGRATQHRDNHSGVV
jgi:hypothetical protein